MQKRGASKSKNQGLFKSFSQISCNIDNPQWWPNIFYLWRLVLKTHKYYNVQPTLFTCCICCGLIKLIIIHYNTQKQKKRTFEPRVKLNHNIYIKQKLPFLLKICDPESKTDNNEKPFECQKCTHEE